MAISCFPYVYLAGSCPLNHFIPKNGPQAISKKEVGGFQSLRNQLCFGYFVCFKKIDIKKKSLCIIRKRQHLICSLSM